MLIKYIAGVLTVWGLLIVAATMYAITLHILQWFSLGCPLIT